jgi:hypothetical protein
MADSSLSMNKEAVQAAARKRQEEEKIRLLRSDAKYAPLWPKYFPGEALPNQWPAPLPVHASKKSPELPSHSRALTAADLAGLRPARRRSRPNNEPIAEPRRNQDSNQVQNTSPDMAHRLLPDWYTSIRPDGRNSKVQRDIIAKTNQIRTLIVDIGNSAEPNSEIFDKLREQLHDAEFLKLNRHTMKQSRLLEYDVGLPRIFNGDLYPWDIRADARELWFTWSHCFATLFEYDPFLLRGIDIRSNTSHRNTDRLGKDYPRRSAAQHGNNNLQNGQWFPTQLCTLRDGAHGVTQGGIYGQEGKGAYSIVLSGGNVYGDRDDGDEIWYRGTDGKGEGEITENTKRMIESYENKLPVRVLRSHNLNKSNEFRPERGFRYDGLYGVVEYRVLDADSGIHSFHLMRKPNQDPIRYRGPEKKPTKQEIAEYDNIRDLIAGII